ncbi:hypothetical protein BGY98DRAFT_971426 [Russula aff. rugulosa BPL654]|nr:hypothetical protein BGY98DRAFT_971426 [Russula aff. rugulosa BPL654]
MTYQSAATQLITLVGPAQIALHQTSFQKSPKLSLAPSLWITADDVGLLRYHLSTAVRTSIRKHVSEVTQPPKIHTGRLGRYQRYHMLFINNVTSSFPLAKNHVFTEVPLNVFGNNRLTFVSDTGKLVKELLVSTWEPSG